MTIKGARVLRNMFLIGGGISVFSFFFAMISFKSDIPSLIYETKKFTGEIKTISNIEDFERTNNCYFLFYDSGSSKGAKAARDYSYGDKSKEEKVIKKAEEKRSDCTKNRYFYIKLNKLNFNY